jgi:hypothetical protein
MTFKKHLEVLKKIYGNPRACGVVIGDKSQSLVPAIFFGWDLDVRQGLFKLMMKCNVAQAMAKVSTLVINKVKPQIVNKVIPLHVYEKSLTFLRFYPHIFLEYLKLA